MTGPSDIPEQEPQGIRESERRLIQKELFRLEDQREAAEQRYRTLFENALVGLFRLDIKREKLITANREMAAAYGYDSTQDFLQWINDTPGNLDIFHFPSNQESADDHYTFTARIKKADSTEFTARFSMRLTEDGRYIEGAVKDITKQDEAIERLRQAKAEAEEANEAKSRFLATMSHEIRTPLNGIIGFAEILMNAAGKDQQKFARKILDESDRLMILINELLDISRLEANKIVLENIIFDLYAILNEVEDSLRRDLNQKGLSYVRNMEEKLSRWYEGDPTRLRQVLLNLLTNAIKFSETGGITLDITSKPYIGIRDLLTFSVTDTGIGIPEDKQELIFNSFEQADSSINRRYGGTGLGISISRELVKLMGGKLKLKSVVGKGSTFYFTIPLDISPKTPEGVPARTHWQTSAAGILGGVRILLVEDYPTNREIVRHHLESAGCRVYTAKNGRHALNFFGGETSVDLIFMDVHMPEVDGLEATRSLRKLGVKTPIIGMTAAAYTDDKEQCMKAGMDDFISKPVRRNSLLEKTVDWIISDGNSTDPASSSPTPEQASAPQTEMTVFRYNEFLRDLDGDAETALELVDGFIEDATRRLNSAERALTAGDYVLLHREIHSVKGGALNLMADEMTAIGLQTEKVVKQAMEGANTEDDIGKLLARLKAAFVRFRTTWASTWESNEANER